MTAKKFKVIVNGQEYQVEIREVDESGIEVLLNGTSYKVTFAEMEGKIGTRSRTAETGLPSGGEGGVGGVSDGFVKAPIPGEVVDVPVTVGGLVAYGDVLVILESMKMKNEIRSPRPGRIKRVMVQVGQMVSHGEALIEFE